MTTAWFTWGPEHYWAAVDAVKAEVNFVESPHQMALLQRLLGRMEVAGPYGAMHLSRAQMDKLVDCLERSMDHFAKEAVEIFDQARRLADLKVPKQRRIEAANELYDRIVAADPRQEARSFFEELESK